MTSLCDFVSGCGLRFFFLFQAPPFRVCTLLHSICNFRPHALASRAANMNPLTIVVDIVCPQFLPQTQNPIPIPWQKNLNPYSSMDGRVSLTLISALVCSLPKMCFHAKVAQHKGSNCHGREFILGSEKRWKQISRCSPMKKPFHVLICVQGLLSIQLFTCAEMSKF